MIINLIIGVLLAMVAGVFSFLPTVNLSSIPVVGSGIASTLLTMTTTWNAFLVTFPYASTAWTVLLTVILPFELLLLIAKFFLGSRVPANPTN